MTIISLAIDQRAAPAIKDADYNAAPKTITALSAGTAWVVSDATLLAIWHLEARDLFSAIRQGDLTARALQLGQISPWAYLIVTGDVDLPGRTWTTVAGALTSIQEAGVTVIRCDHVQLVPELIVMLAHRGRERKRLRPPRDILFVDPGEDLLLAIPGVGPAVLDDLLDSCATAGAALVALTQGNRITGVPANVYAAARQTLGLGDNVALELTAIAINEDEEIPDAITQTTAQNGDSKPGRGRSARARQPAES